MRIRDEFQKKCEKEKPLTLANIINSYAGSYSISPDRFQTPNYYEYNSNKISGRAGELFNICGSKVITNPRPNRPKTSYMRNSKQKSHNVTPILGTEEMVS
jgi:hypothetical protein